MNKYRGILFDDLRQEEAQKSVGAICEECNQRAYYFNIKNADFFCEKCCLICSQNTSKGILLEDFLHTLTGKLSNHYELSQDNISGTVTISLKQILKRFTYDNDQVVERLADLLCQYDGSFYQIKGVYRSKIDIAFIEQCKNEAIEEWNKFSKDLKHNRRFTHIEASHFYERLISACMHQIKSTEEFNSALKTIKKGTTLYRGRLVKDDVHKDVLLSKPEQELSAPPSYLAANSRMSPPGISFMYMAGDPETSIAELRPYVNDTIAVGEFVSTKEFNFFDFTLLDRLKHEDANILDDPKNDKYFQSRYLLSSLHELISRPFRVTDTSYIETQMFAETIRNYRDGIFDGIIFGSSQRDGGLNYVLFGDDSKNDNRGVTPRDYHMKIDSTLGIQFYQVLKIEATTQKIDKQAMPRSEQNFA